MEVTLKTRKPIQAKNRRRQRVCFFCNSKLSKKRPMTHEAFPLAGEPDPKVWPEGVDPSWKCTDDNACFERLHYDRGRSRAAP